MVANNEFGDLIKDFLAESRENLDRLDQDFVVLESAPSDSERIASIFRTIHTLKSSCGYFGFSKLGALAHAGESLLSRLRDGTLSLSPSMTTTLLHMVDGVRKTLTQVETHQEEGEGDHAELIQRLQAFEHGSPSPSKLSSPEISLAPLETPHMTSDTLLRVDLQILDKLMNLVGELVLTRNQVLKHTAAERGSTSDATTQQLHRITSEIQETVMKTRLQPISSVWQKFPRLVRDLSITCGKKVRLQMDGEATELDKTLLEAIKDPLAHLLRNALDHGVESPAERLAQGKSEEGTVSLRAFHEAGSVIIEMKDDGKGIDLARIKIKALQQGLLRPEQASSIKEDELMDLIFKPGFSTSDIVTAVSGRGVGMDVVKNNIERIGGVIDLKSQPGVGTTFTIRIPLTLAIISALIITCQGARYAIPQTGLMEVFHLTTDKSIENFLGVPVYRLRGQILPLVFLDQLLGRESSAGIRAPSTSFQIVVIKASHRQFGLVVDEIQNTEEIVVKPLAKRLRTLSLFSGATVMGDGRVALILDTMSVARQAGIRTSEQNPFHRAEVPAEAVDSQERQSLLIVEHEEQGRFAIPLGCDLKLIDQFPQIGSHLS